MAAQAQPPQRRAEVEFPPNIGVTVSMKFAQPKLVSGMSGDRYLFTTCDNRVFFLDPEVAGQIEAQGINVREDFSITRKTDGKKGSPITWEIARIAAPQIGQQPDGTYIVPRDPEAPAPKPPMRAERSEHVSSMTLTQEAKFAVDAFAEVLEHGLTAHNGKVKPDEIQRIFTTVYIQRKGAA
jgi:hypothetical protein